MCFLYSGVREQADACCAFSSHCYAGEMEGGQWGVSQCHFFKAGISMLLWFHSFTIAIHFVPISIGPFSGSGFLPGFW